MEYIEGISIGEFTFYLITIIIFLHIVELKALQRNNKELPSWWLKVQEWTRSIKDKFNKDKK